MFARFGLGRVIMNLINGVSNGDPFSIVVTFTLVGLIGYGCYLKMQKDE